MASPPKHQLKIGETSQELSEGEEWKGAEVFFREKDARNLDLTSQSLEKHTMEWMKVSGRFGIRQGSSLEDVVDIFRTGLILWLKCDKMITKNNK